MSDNTNTQALPGDLAYLPPEYRGLAVLRTKQLCAIFSTSRETIRKRCNAGKLPAPIADSDPHRPRWSAVAINELIAQQANQKK
jgi:predicted DNA-binding transcriptional regulator AlpA